MTKKKCPFEKTRKDAEAFDASPEGQETLRALEKECVDQKSKPLGRTPFIAYTDEDGDVYSLKKATKLADDNDLPF